MNLLEEYLEACEELRGALGELDALARAEGGALLSLRSLLEAETLDLLGDKTSQKWEPKLPPTREAVIDAYARFKVASERVRDAWALLPPAEKAGRRHPFDKGSRQREALEEQVAWGEMGGTLEYFMKYSTLPPEVSEGLPENLKEELKYLAEEVVKTSYLTRNEVRG